jgi:uncharacterized membrane protein YdjX (TVP38/TMEM64 family)
MLRKTLLTIFAVCAAFFAVLFAAHAPLALWVIDVVQRIRSLGVAGGIVFTLVYVLLTLLFFPQTPLNLAAGFLYGTCWGSVIITIASTLTAAFAFLLARYSARGFVVRNLSRFGRFENIDSAIERNGLKLVLLMRLQPVFVPFAYLNVGLGLTRVSLLDYVVGTFLGVLPGTILIAYLGSAARDLPFYASGSGRSEQMASAWLFWAGLVAVAALSVVLAHIAHQSFGSAIKHGRK